MEDLLLIEEYENKPVVTGKRKVEDDPFVVLNIKEKYRSKIDAILDHDYDTANEFGHHLMQTIEGDIIILAHGGIRKSGPILVLAGKVYPAAKLLSYINKHIPNKKISLVSCYCGKIIRDTGEKIIKPVFDVDTTIWQNKRYPSPTRMADDGERYFEFILERPSL